MKLPAYTAIVVLAIFFAMVLGVAFWYNPHFPVRVLAGEQSVGTWLSGTLLTMMATLSLVTGIKQRWHPWLLLTAFFLLLALDERFMFHERLKEHIIFSQYADTLPQWLYELPVIIGACAGGVMALMLWHNLQGKSRFLLILAAIMGIVSVVIDILAAGVLWEECFKLTAELIMTCVLVFKVSES
jgi:hypothetical protein